MALGQARRDGCDLEARRASAHAVSLGDRVSGGVCARERRVRRHRRKSAICGKNTHHLRQSDELISPGLQTLHEGAHGNADLVAHFFRRAFSLSATMGRFRSDRDQHDRSGRHARHGLATILSDGGADYPRQRRLKWPGEAAVVVSVVHVVKGRSALDRYSTDDRSTNLAYLVASDLDRSPTDLLRMRAKSSRARMCLEWASPSTMTLQPKAAASSIAEMQRLISKDPRNQRANLPIHRRRGSQHRSRRMRIIAT